jgi:hypothetical protein
MTFKILITLNTIKVNVFLPFINGGGKLCGAFASI